MNRIRKTITAASVLAVVIFLSANALASPAVREVIPGGMPFGVKIMSEGPTVAGFSDVVSGSVKKSPAKDSGLTEGDVITKIGDTPVKTAGDVINAVENASGKTEVTFRRDGSEHTVSVDPVTSDTDGKQKIGLLIKDSTAGIGTVTFIVPETGAFMGLGHGICDSETGEPVPVVRGLVTDVTITGAEKGEAGDPGELKGSFLDRERGVIKKNTDSGVFGFFTDGTGEGSDTVSIGGRDDVNIGDAYIISTVSPDGPRKYDVRIECIPAAKDAKSFEIRVTDPDLIESTGGIVRGMSGSPVFQNGRLIGAVTHVMINDPERGYGIFIDEMTDEVSL